MVKKILNLLINSPNIFFKEFKEYLKKLSEAPNYYFKELINYLKIKQSFIPNYPFVGKLNNDLYFIFDFLNDRRLQKMYNGIYHSHIIHFFKKHLNKGDIFIDVGANIGYLTVIAAGFVGKEGEVHSFEPVPIYYDRLLKTARLNKQYKIYTNNLAIGSFFGTADIWLSKYNNIGWNSMVPGYVDLGTIKERVKVNVIRLDDYIFKHRIDNVSLIKIDVEGYEYNVLKGLTNFFKKKNNLPNLIVEIFPLNTIKTTLPNTLKDIEDLMKEFNYQTFNIINERPIDIKKLNVEMDVLFKAIQ